MQVIGLLQAGQTLLGGVAGGTPCGAAEADVLRVDVVRSGSFAGQTTHGRVAGVAAGSAAETDLLVRHQIGSARVATLTAELVVAGRAVESALVALFGDGILVRMRTQTGIAASIL